jgi:hypothetical protein
MISGLVFRLVSAGDVLAISDENYTGEVESISHQR